MAGIDCPSPDCDFTLAIGIGPTDALTVIAKREEGDTRFRIYISGGPMPVLKLIHTCGDDGFGGSAGDREPLVPRLRISPHAEAPPALPDD